MDSNKKSCPCNLGFYNSSSSPYTCSQLTLDDESASDDTSESFPQETKNNTSVSSEGNSGNTSSSSENSEKKEDKSEEKKPS